MSFEYIQEIPGFEEIIAEMPIDDELRAVKRERDRRIADVLTGKSDRFLLIIGPCSAHHEGAVYEYVRRLARVQEKVQDKLVIIPRVYTNKPRTTGQGYKGLLHQPDPAKKPDIVKGVKALRTMHIRVIRESGLTAADEMLYPENYSYLADLLSYVAIGARSVENQQHRLTVSGLDVAAGMKNPTSGDISVMLNSVKAAQSPHVFGYHGWQVQTSGNPLVHTVLRGATDSQGKSIPNYHYEHLMNLAEVYLQSGLVNPAILVDTNHSNSDKQYAQQPRIAREVMGNRAYLPQLKRLVKGLMIESFLVEGAQGEDGTVFGQSITDPCLGWEESERLILDIADWV